MREWHDQHLAWAINLHFTLLRFAPTTLSMKLETHSSIYSISYSIFDHQQHCRSKSGRLSQWVPSRKTKKYSRKFQLSFCMCFSFALAVAITALCYFMYIFLQQRAQKGGEKTRRIIFVIKIPFCSYSTKNILETLRFFSFIRSIFFLFSPSSLIFLQLLLAANSGSSSAIQTRTQQH